MRRIAARQKDRFKTWLERMLDDHGAKILVILIGLLVVVPAAITWRYLTTTATVADEAKEASQTNRRLARENRRLTERVAGLQRETTEALVESCRHNGNAMRRILREEQRAALTSPGDPKLRVLFPNVSPAAIADIVRDSNRRHLERIHALHRVPCRVQYPIP